MYLLDSDAARKLCQYQLIHELTRALECALTDLAVLPQLIFQLRLNEPETALKKLGSDESVIMAIELVRHANTVEVLMEQSNHILDFDRPDIDSGEAVLFAALYQNAQDRLISGDKRAFVALSNVTHPISTEGIWARLICLEEAILLILEREDFDQVSAKVRARTDVDKAISVVFGRTQAASHASVLEGLTSYIQDLDRSTGGRWLDLQVKCTSNQRSRTGASMSR
ncbi:hypothetical protein N8H72_08680 [Pseudomonas koreensis]|uniref:hypothetical protein n=1 Tax=Pseudomonas koreensis TaxID=198620 RepID=UPI0021C9383B|nr:hypothetical protein [Pseudomonas koreensis]MCU0090030.1 hypothetical protein [Pseudomonas koreensis]